MPKTTQQLTPTSRALHKVDRYTSVPSATPILIVALSAAILVGAALGFPSGWALSFEVGTSALTLIMVTVIQHTQSREQTATQRKLEELLRASPLAQTGLMMLEEESDETIRQVEDLQRQSKTQQQTHPA